MNIANDFLQSNDWGINTGEGLNDVGKIHESGRFLDDMRPTDYSLILVLSVNLCLLHFDARTVVEMTMILGFFVDGQKPVNIFGYQLGDGLI